MDTVKITKTWKARLKKAGFNQAEFGALVSIDQGAISLYFNGKKIPSIETFDKIENGFKFWGV
jgi:transcriptional regulator with XRE-family HTH domain